MIQSYRRSPDELPGAGCGWAGPFLLFVTPAGEGGTTAETRYNTRHRSVTKNEKFGNRN